MTGWVLGVMLAGVLHASAATAGVLSAVATQVDVLGAVATHAHLAHVAALHPGVQPTTSLLVSEHDFHVSYTRMAVEPRVISAQIRLFTDDLTQALIKRTQVSGLILNSPAGEAAFQAYVAEKFVVTVNGRRLVPVVGTNVPDRDMSSYVVQWESPVPITSVTARNGALMELFGDQQNIVKVKHLATGKEETLFFAGGAATDQTFRF
jgi:hypothetical protein